MNQKQNKSDYLIKHGWWIGIAISILIMFINPVAGFFMFIMLFSSWIGAFIVYKILNKDKNNDLNIISKLESDMNRMVTEHENKINQLNSTLTKDFYNSERAKAYYQGLSEKYAPIYNQYTKNQELINTLIAEANEKQSIVDSLNRILHGYSDEFIIPQYTFVDELANELSHTQAAQKLKAQRLITSNLIKSAAAIKHDIDDPAILQSAKLITINWFNLESEKILNKIKTNNIGVLQQELKDLFNLINGTCKIIDIKLTNKLLESKNNELKWLVVVFTLKEEEKAQQQAIREQIKDEERARREYEASIRKSQEEEKKLHEMIEFAKQKSEEATSEQKAKYDQQIIELELKLKEAEEKNQRAKSMAEQTKSGHVYVISNIGAFGENVYKIGMTRRLEPLDRITELGDASVPFSFDVHGMVYSDNAPELEKSLHKIFLKEQVNKVNPRKEFFRLNINQIKGEIDKLGYEVNWTMLAEATQYRETLKIEEELASNTHIAQVWKNSQTKDIENLVAN